MSWRTVVISNRCKLDLKMGYMVVRGEETKRVFLDEISTLVIENNAVSLTCCLLEALCEKKVNVLFCDGKRNPMAELSPLYGSHDCSRKIREQVAWPWEIKTAVWTEIVKEKIHRQAVFLEEIGKEEEAFLLREYIAQMEPGDATNREGHAAKVYFNAVFGLDFTRDADCVVNSALNYGYAILLSAVNREVYSGGYITQLGLHHSNVFNKFNFSCDLMEPFRILVDRHVYYSKYEAFALPQKYEMLAMFNEGIMVNHSRQTVWNAVKIYTKSVFNALNECDLSAIKFAEI